MLGMDDQVTPALAQSSAARAFEDLRNEVSLLRRAIEGLTAERRDQPDYGPTLEALATSNEQIRDWAKKVSERPGIQLTPRQISEQIDASVASRRQHDRQELAAMHNCLATAIEEVKALTRQARTSYEQVRREKIAGGVCLLVGLVLGLLLPQIGALGDTPTRPAGPPYSGSYLLQLSNEKTSGANLPRPASPIFPSADDLIKIYLPPLASPLL